MVNLSLATNERRVLERLALLTLLSIALMLLGSAFGDAGLLLVLIGCAVFAIGVYALLLRRSAPVTGESLT